jgi:hypothetical protein
MGRRAVFLLMVFAAAVLYAERHDVPKLTLSAAATLWKPADELQMKIGVVTLGETADEALRENSAKMQGIVANLEVDGMEKGDFETSQFSINPTYAPYPVNPPPNWRPSIVGYEVTNSIQIHTPKLDRAGSWIDAANRAGANQISDIRFGLRSSRDYWTEALSAAGANAVSDAQAIARATGVRLVRVLSISLNHAHVRSPQINVAALAKASHDAAPPIEAGEVSIEASVSLVYEID